MKSKNTWLVLINTVTLVAMLIANYVFNSGILANATVGDISIKYDTLFTPAGYTFSIWGIIFLLCTCFVAKQWHLLRRDDAKEYINRTGFWFALSNMVNILWLFCWTSEKIGWSLLLICVLLFSLIVLTIKLRLELDDEPVQIIFFTWWPIAFYLGWIMVATIANVAAWLVFVGWSGGAFGEENCTIIMIGAASLLYIYLVIKRNLRESAIVGIWAFIGIAVKQRGDNTSIVAAAIVAAAILLVTISVHGYKNRHFSPLNKLQRGEW